MLPLGLRVSDAQVSDVGTRIGAWLRNIPESLPERFRGVAGGQAAAMQLRARVYWISNWITGSLDHWITSLDFP
jgi:hypothetical protein